MTYAKPEVAVLGNASAVIEHIGKLGAPGDGGVYPFNSPAYDLDE
jgi:hypothetical protein